MKYERMDEDGYANLMGYVRDEQMGTEYGWACNAAEEDHLHLRRIGPEKCGLLGRVAFTAHSGPDAATIFLSAAEARTVAAAILDAADELDGATPLHFVEQPKAIGDLDTPEED